MLKVIIFTIASTGLFSYSFAAHQPDYSLDDLMTSIALDSLMDSPTELNQLDDYISTLAATSNQNIQQQQECAIKEQIRRAIEIEHDPMKVWQLIDANNRICTNAYIASLLSVAKDELIKHHEITTSTDNDTIKDYVNIIQMLQCMIVDAPEK